jgi:N-acetylmuramoyl-L-alanine amidase
MKRENWVAILPFYLLVIICFVGVATLGSRIASTFASETSTNETTIVIDAGHGGIDGGATSCTGVLESQLNLEIAVRLDTLMHLLGYRTKMIRTDDVSIYTTGNTIAAQKVSDLKERVRIVNEMDNCILVSIHQNTYPDSRYSGAQVFYGPCGNSKLLADELQKSLIQYVNPGSNRSTKKADGIYLMQHIDQEGILVECGFLSNPEEEAKLRNPEYQKQLGCVIAASLCRFLNA